MTTEKIEQPSRIKYLDGLRGIASLFVVFTHLARVFFPNLYYYNMAASAFERFFCGSPLNVITNGKTAVHCFFVLSGFLIARKMYQQKSNGNRTLSPVRQYVKFVKLVFPAVMLAAILMWCGLMFHLKAAAQNPSLGFVLDYNNFKPTFLSAFIVDPFFNVFVDESLYIAPFWTIRFEFYGGILITIVSYFAKDHIRIAKLTYIFCGIVFALISPNLTSFVVGAFVFDCIERKEDDASLLGKCTRWILSKKILLALLGILGIYLASINHTLTGIWAPLKHISFVLSYLDVIRAVGIGICLICIFEFAVLQKILSFKPLNWLGKISAYTYAFHWPITLSLGCGLYLLLAKTTLPYYAVVSIISAAVIFVTMGLAFSYTKLVPLMRKAEKLGFDKLKGLLMKFKKEKSINS